jgi:excisionase family DNA binding protein
MAYVPVRKSQRQLQQPSGRRGLQRARTLSDELCTVQFAAEQLKLHRKTILRFIREGRLPAMRVGKSYRIKRSDLHALAGLPAQNEIAAPSPSVTSIIDIPGVDPALARKWASTVTSALNARSKDGPPMRAEILYESERSHLKIIVVGAPSDSVNLLSMIRIWLEQLRA